MQIYGRVTRFSGSVKISFCEDKRLKDTEKMEILQGFLKTLDYIDSIELLTNGENIQNGSVSFQSYYRKNYIQEPNFRGNNMAQWLLMCREPVPSLLLLLIFVSSQN